MDFSKRRKPKNYPNAMNRIITGNIRYKDLNVISKVLMDIFKNLEITAFSVEKLTEICIEYI